MAKFTKKWKNPGSEAGNKYRGLYNSWNHMINRAGNNDGKNPTYSDVIVCDRWLSYDNFFEDMADTWFSGATIDKDSIKPGNRIYCKEYCKWISQSENSKERIKRCGSPAKINAPFKGKFGAEHNTSKKVKCLDNGEVFGSAQEACRKFNVGLSSISKVCRGERKSIRGYHFEYVEEE